MNTALWIKHACEYLGGARDNPPDGLRMGPRSLFWALWWGVLIAAIITFGGQTSKFIYIDF